MVASKLTLTGKTPESFSGDLLIYCLARDKKEKVLSQPRLLGRELKKAIGLGDFKAKEEESLLLYPQGSHKQKVQAKRVLVLGLGQLDDCSFTELCERCRKLGGLMAAKAAELKAKKIYLCLPEIRDLSAESTAECLVEGTLLGDYRFLKYKDASKKSSAFGGIHEIAVFDTKGRKGVRRGMKRAQNSAHAACAARDMANEPGNGWTPASFAKYARSLARTHKMKCTVLSKADMKRLKMGGILGVNQGSAEPPKMVILEYRAKNKKAETLLVVGKGLTFDSGGVSLKPSAGMQDMKYDMCGGAAALSVMGVVGEEKPDVNVVAIIPATDNMGGSSALKPGDIIRHYGGITSEIVNTDAEGRMILGDALAYGIKKFSPTCVVDLATLTGAVIIGLGHHRTGLLSNNQELVDRLLTAGERCGEPLWQLPLDKEYVEQIDSDVADIKNTGGRPAGTITAAAYLQKFVGDTPWAHLDIAGTAWDFTKKSYIPKGPSGTGVRTLAELVRSWKKFKA
ncbi:MAG: leucyl aminopeptidase [Thermodesulfobacteriota bacterium]